MKQFHNKNQNCLIAFPINLTVCVEELGSVYSELQDLSHQRIHDVSSKLVGVHKLKIGHDHNLFFALIE